MYRSLSRCIYNRRLPYIIYNSIIVYFTEAGEPQFSGIFFKKKRYVHFGLKAAEAVLSKIAVLANNNEIFFCYSVETINILTTCADTLNGFKVQNKTTSSKITRSPNIRYSLTILVNNKLIFIKLVHSFINLSIVDIYQIANKS